MRWLAYVHPAAMVAVLVLGLLVLREGLQIRRARLARKPFASTTHRSLARVFVPVALAGYALGLVSMAALRGKPLAQSVHFPLATVAALALAAAGGLGLWLERGAVGSARTAHALLGAAGVLFALGAAVAGMAILP